MVLSVKYQQTSRSVMNLFNLILVISSISVNAQIAEQSGSTNVVNGFLGLLGNIPIKLPLPFLANGRPREKVDADNGSAKEKEKRLANNESNNPIAERENILIPTSPNLLNFGAEVVGGAVDGGSRIVGDVFKFIGDIPRNLPRPSITITRVTKDEVVEERSGRAEKDDDFIEEQQQVANVICETESPNTSLIEMVGNISYLTIFHDLLVVAEVEKEFGEDDVLTVLAPNNDAFVNLEDVNLRKLRKDKESAKQTVFKYILPEPLCCADISRNNGFFFNNSRRRSHSGGLISVSHL